MQDKGLEEIIKKAEGDVSLKSYFGSNKPITSGLLNDIGKLMEERGGKTVAKARLRDKGGDIEENVQAFSKLYEYIELIDDLNLPRYIKGYIINKLDKIATVKIG